MRSVRCCSGTGARGSCALPATSARVSMRRRSRRCARGWRRCIRERSPFAAAPPLHRPTTWVAPEARRRGQLRRVDARWAAARAGVRAGARRRRAAQRDARTVQRTRQRRASPRACRRAAARAQPPSQAMRSTRSCSSSTRPGQRLDLELDGDAAAPHQSGSRVLAGRSRVGQRPAVTKRDLIRYLAAVSRFMLPHLKDRPLTMIRMPEGIDGERFFQKHWEQPLPDFVRDGADLLGPSGRAAGLPAGEQSADTAVARRRTARSSFTSGIHAPRLEADARQPQHAITRARSRPSRPRCSTTPTTWCSTSIPISIRARGRAAASPSSTSAVSRVASTSRSGCGSCWRRCRSRHS